MLISCAVVTHISLQAVHLHSFQFLSKLIKICAISKIFW